MDINVQQDSGGKLFLLTRVICLARLGCPKGVEFLYHESAFSKEGGTGAQRRVDDGGKI